jgi:hypothetical protein
VITNFEDITYELTKEEMALIPPLVKGFSTHTVDNPIKAPEIVAAMRRHLKSKGSRTTFSEARLRKCCNYIRGQGLLPLIATSKGYFVSRDRVVIESQIRSLVERADAIAHSAHGLNKFITD